MPHRDQATQEDPSTLLATVTTAEQPHSDSTPELRTGLDSRRESDVLVFPDLEGFYRTFTPRTLELIEVIRREGPASITETAHMVERDVKNVHTELHHLDDMGVLSFVREGRANRPVVKYDEVQLCISFTERASAPETRPTRSHPHASEEVYSRISDGVIALDAAARVTYVNERGEELLKQSSRELVGSVIWDAFPEATGTAFEEQYREAIRTQELVTYEEYSPLLDAWFAIRVYPTESSVTVYFRDVTERKRREQQLEYQRNELAAINHLNRVIQKITHTAIETSSREQIEQQVCNQLVDSDLYTFAWTGSVEQGRQEVTPDRMAGGERSYLDEFRISIERTDVHGRGPTGTAVRTHEPQFVQDTQTESDYDPWQTRARERGFRASAAIPILHDGVLYSVLNLYATQPNAFTKPVREAIGHLGLVIGHAIHAVEQRKALLNESIREIELRNEQFAQRLVGSNSDVLLSVERTVPIGDDEILHFMTVSGMSSDEFVESITRVPTVKGVTPLNTGTTENDKLLFEVTISEPSLSGTLVSYGGRVQSVRTTSEETRIVAEVPPSTPIREVVEAVNEVHPGTELLAQRTVERGPKTTQEIYREVMDRLTTKQRAALETAYFAGYFDWPRAATGEEVADILGVAASTYTNHLRTAERKLLSVLFSDE